MTEAEILKKHLSQAGKKGYVAMRKKLTPEQIKKNARKGGKARWKKMGQAVKLDPLFVSQII